MSNIATRIFYEENKEFIDYVNKCGGVVPTKQCKEIISEALKNFKINKEQLRKSGELLIPKLKWYQKILQKLHIKNYYKDYNEYVKLLERIEDK